MKEFASSAMHMHQSFILVLCLFALFMYQAMGMQIHPRMLTPEQIALRTELTRKLNATEGSHMLGWGVAGHQLTAGIAQRLLGDAAEGMVEKILSANQGSMMAVSAWADDVKHTPEYAWSYDLHFINTPDWACDFSPSRDCANDICVYAAVKNYTTRVANKELSSDQVTIAMKFLIHFVGDIHQPLHCGFASDKGGNSYHGTFEYSHTNLHQIWDEKIILKRISDDFDNDQDKYLDHLTGLVQGDWASNATIWSECPDHETDCPYGWANESAKLACDYAYVTSQGDVIRNDFKLGNDYYEFTLPIVELQLARGGVRLASVLNKIWPSEN